MKKNKIIFTKTHLSHFCFFLVAGATIIPAAFGAEVSQDNAYTVDDLKFTTPTFSILNAENKEEAEENTNLMVETSGTDFSVMTKTEIESYKIMLKEKMGGEEKVYIDITDELEKADTALNTGNYLHPYTQEQVNLLAYAIFREAGSNWLTDRHRDLVGCVYINRQAQGGINQTLTNPSLADIMNEPGQYPYKSWNVTLENIPDYCFESAVRVLERKVECPENVVYQASFKQGSGVYDKFVDSCTGVVTYFCFR